MSIIYHMIIIQLVIDIFHTNITTFLKITFILSTVLWYYNISLIFYFILSHHLNFLNSLFFVIAYALRFEFTFSISVVFKILLIIFIFVLVTLLYKLIYNFIIDNINMKKFDKTRFIGLNVVFGKVYYAIICRI